MIFIEIEKFLKLNLNWLDWSAMERLDVGMLMDVHGYG